MGGSELSPPFWLVSNQNGNVYKPPSLALRANPKQMKSLYPSLPNTTVRYICYSILREARPSARLVGNCCWLSLSARSMAQRVQLPTHSPARFTRAASNSITQRTHGGAKKASGRHVLEVLKTNILAWIGTPRMTSGNGTYPEQCRVLRSMVPPVSGARHRRFSTIFPGPSLCDWTLRVPGAHTLCRCCLPALRICEHPCGNSL